MASNLQILKLISQKLQKIKMVKTRKQTKQSQKNTNKQFLPIPPKKERRVKKNILINRDTLRERLKDKMLKQRKENKCIKIKQIDFNSKELNSIITAQKFNCPICLEIMIFPVLTHCGHAFCLPCIEQSLIHKNLCSLCREPINYQTIKQSKLIQELISKVCQKEMKEQEILQYKKRIREFKEKDQERKDSQIQIGELVDFYGNRKWHQGVVVQIDSSGQEPIVKIESTQRQAKIYQFKLSSRLFAKHRYFTKENTLFRELMGQFRLEISGLGDIPIFVHLSHIQQNLINVQINPVRSDLFEDGSQELIRFTFSFQP